jgi:hypothetical protein
MTEGDPVLLWWHGRWRLGVVAQETKRQYRIRHYVKGRGRVTIVHKLDVAGRLLPAGSREALAEVLAALRTRDEDDVSSLPPGQAEA